jgi:hypothetical protein
MPARGAVVLVHRCYWHLHTCKRGRSAPATNVTFWRTRRARTQRRDRRALAVRSSLLKRPSRETRPPHARRHPHRSTIEIRNILLDEPAGTVYVRYTGGACAGPAARTPGRAAKEERSHCVQNRDRYGAGRAGYLVTWRPRCLVASLPHCLIASLPGGIVAFSKKKNANRTQFSALALSKTRFRPEKRTQSNRIEPKRSAPFTPARACARAGRSRMARGRRAQRNHR